MKPYTALPIELQQAVARLKVLVDDMHPALTDWTGAFDNAADRLVDILCFGKFARVCVLPEDVMKHFNVSEEQARVFLANVEHRMKQRMHRFKEELVRDFGDLEQLPKSDPPPVSQLG